MSGFQGIMAGPALTVKARAGDNLFLHQALDMAQPGDVIVLSNDEDTTRSLMGRFKNTRFPMDIFLAFFLLRSVVVELSPF